MLDFTKLKRKPQASEYVGTRIDEVTKQALESFCIQEQVTVSKLLNALITKFLKSQGRL